MIKASRKKALDAHCRKCGGADGGSRHWRAHVSVCPVTDCDLWPFRPLTNESPPEWLTSRDPARLPPGFQKLRTDEALALLKGISGSDQRGGEVSRPTDRGGEN